MQLSVRLKTVAGMLECGKKVADVGTDHGYIPIFLVKTGICESGIAMDVRKGPLKRAEEHIRQYNLQDKIKTRLSDGVNKLQPGEADCMIIAGMGGNLTIHILEEGRAAISKMREFILQPQSEIAKVRAYLQENGYLITNEEMVFEEGKYYPMMRVVYDPEKVNELSQIQLRYGPILLRKKHPVLLQYVQKEYADTKKLIKKLEYQLPYTKERLEQLDEKRKLMEGALKIYDLSADY